MASPHVQSVPPRQPLRPTVPCDLCQAPFQIPQHCIDQGRIEGLLTCSQCSEDEAESRVFQ